MMVLFRCYSNTYIFRVCVYGGGGVRGIRLAGILLHVGADSKKYLVKTNLDRKMGGAGSFRF